MPLETPEQADPIDELSPRRREVLDLLIRGLTNREIGDLLQISPYTVRAHVTAVLSQLGVSNRTEAASLVAASRARLPSVQQFVSRPGLAVLPLQPLAEDPRTRTLAAGMSRDLRSLFARWTWFPVLSRSQASEVPRATGAAEGEQLVARFIVGGELRPMRDAWRLTARLEDCVEARLIWSESFDFPDHELFQAQDAVVESVVRVAYSVLTSYLLRAPPPAAPVEDLSAWELAHRGLLTQGARGPEANGRAMRLFDEALARDPSLVVAHFGRGMCFYNAVLNQWGQLPDSSHHLGACAQRCIELAPHAAEGYFLRGRYFVVHGEHDPAIATLSEAIGRNPSFGPAHALLGQILLFAGRAGEAPERMKHAAFLGPLAVVSGQAFAQFLGGDFRAALRDAEVTLASTPDYSFARMLAVSSAWLQGERERAMAHACDLRQRHPSFDPALFFRTFTGDDPSGRMRQMRQAFAEADARPSQDGVVHLYYVT
jgi:TolB-like protein